MTRPDSSSFRWPGLTSSFTLLLCPGLLQSLSLPPNPKHPTAAWLRNPFIDQGMRRGGLLILSLGVVSALPPSTAPRPRPLSPASLALAALILTNGQMGTSSAVCARKATGRAQMPRVCTHLCVGKQEAKDSTTQNVGTRVVNVLHRQHTVEVSACLFSQVWVDGDHSHQPPPLALGRDQRHLSHGN